MEQENKSYQDDQIEALVQSMCGPMASKIKIVMKKALKNRQLGENVQLTALIDLLLEQLIPQYCVANYQNSKNLNLMHNLVYLLQMKVQTVFTSGVIRTCIDQNWDLKGLKAVILRILKILEIEEQDKRISTLFDKLVQSQNLQSQACIKAIAYFLKNSRKNIEEDDLRNPILTYQTTFNFVRDDIQHFRDQKMKPSCFSVLHPWAYDLDSVDFKYIVNRDLVSQICSKLKSRASQVFWLSFFKSQTSCSADEFFTAIKELSEINLIPGYFKQKLSIYKDFMTQCNYVVSINEHADFINQFIDDFNAQSQQITGFNVLRDQVRTLEGNREVTEYIDEGSVKVYRIDNEPSFSLFSKGQLKDMKFVSYKPEQLRQSMQIYRRVIAVDPPKAVNKKVTLKFISVDTDELQGTEISYNGTNSFYKVGEGDLNHFQILNDKKLWESQFMLVCKDGQFYIRDLGIVHTSRVKVDKGLEIQLQRGSVVDMGKVIHYHFDKITYRDQPQTQSTNKYLVMRPNEKYVVEDEDPVLRARPTWVSQDENKDLIQNEILITVEEGKNVFSVGRSVKRDIEIKLKAVSADHCTIAYNDQKGWIIHENGKEKPSSNGTFVFMKSQGQMDDHEPSALIPLHDGMIISFINYELEVHLSEKDGDEILLEEDERKKRHQKLQEELQDKRYEMNFDQTYNQKVKGNLEKDLTPDPKKVYEENQQKKYEEKMYGKNENDHVIKPPNVNEFDINNRLDEEQNRKMEEEERRKEEQRLEQLKAEKEQEERRLQEEATRQMEEERQRREEEEMQRLVKEQQQRQQEEAERRHREAEAHRKQQEEEEHQRKLKLEEEQRQHREEEERRKQQEEEEEERQRQQEQERKEREDEEAQRQKEEEEARVRRHQEEEEQKRKEEQEQSAKIEHELQQTHHVERKEEQKNEEATAHHQAEQEQAHSEHQREQHADSHHQHSERNEEHAHAHESVHHEEKQEHHESHPHHDERQEHHEQHTPHESHPHHEERQEHHESHPHHQEQAQEEQYHHMEEKQEEHKVDQKEETPTPEHHNHQEPAHEHHEKKEEHAQEELKKDEENKEEQNEHKHEENHQEKQESHAQLEHKHEESHKTEEKHEEHHKAEEKHEVPHKAEEKHDEKADDNKPEHE